MCRESKLLCLPTTVHIPFYEIIDQIGTSRASLWGTGLTLRISLERTSANAIRAFFLFFFQSASASSWKRARLSSLCKRRCHRPDLFLGPRVHLAFSRRAVFRMQALETCCVGFALLLMRCDVCLRVAAGHHLLPFERSRSVF